MFSAEFGQRLLAYRKERRLTARQLGVAIGLNENVAAQHIYRYERGVHTPHIYHLVALTKALDVSADDLLNPDPQPKDRLLRQLGRYLAEDDLRQVITEKGIPHPA